MDFKEVKKFIDLAKKEGAASLEYSSGDKKIAVSFGVQMSSATHPAPLATAPLQNGAAEAIAQSSKSTSASSHHEVKSPLVGTFYSQTGPGEPPFVQMGSKVNKGQTLCIIEAMKIMNEVEADKSGEVVEICVDDESLVEFGQTLFRIK